MSSMKSDWQGDLLSDWIAFKWERKFIGFSMLGVT